MPTRAFANGAMPPTGASPLPGPSGNVEYFLHLRAGAPGPEPEDVERAVAAGPR